jgi:hypothetical protein
MMMDEAEEVSGEQGSRFFWSPRLLHSLKTPLILLYPVPIDPGSSAPSGPAPLIQLLQPKLSFLYIFYFIVLSGRAPNSLYNF